MRLQILLLIFAFSLIQLGQPAFAQDDGSPRFTYDLGASSGTINNNSFVEADLGLNYFPTSYLDWRNAPFYQFVSGASNVLGLDTSLRFIGRVGNEYGLTAFVGPGYRFVTVGPSAPLVEGGVIFKVAGIGIGGGIKTVFNNLVQPGYGNENIIFIILSGGGSF